MSGAVDDARPSSRLAARNLPLLLQRFEAGGTAQRGEQPVFGLNVETIDRSVVQQVLDLAATAETVGADLQPAGTAAPPDAQLAMQPTM